MMQFLLDFAVLLVKCVWFLFLSWVEFFQQFVSPKIKDVRGQTVVITGAGSGLGRLLAIRFGRLGCRVIGWDINESGLKETQRLIHGENKDAEVMVVVGDVSKREECYAKAKSILSMYGDVDILVNNAGIVNGSRLLDTDDSSIQKTIDINLMSHFWITKAFLPSMISRGSGHLVYTSSCAGMVGGNRLTDYCASKAGDLIFTESLSRELKVLAKETHFRIPITVFAPFLITTGMFRGCKSRYQLLLPDLDPNYAADRAMSAILSEQKLLAIPRSIYLLVAVKAILPITVSDLLIEFVGGDSFMDPFRGSTSRKKMS